MQGMDNSTANCVLPLQYRQIAIRIERRYYALTKPYALPRSKTLARATLEIL